MKTANTVILGLLASALSLGTANAQGLLGQRYVDINGGYERFKYSEPGFSVTIDGWGAGGGINIPVIPASGQAGLDLELSGDYIRGTEGGGTLTVIQGGGLLRAFIPVNPGVKPFVGAGAEYIRVKGEGNGVSTTDDSIYIPIEAGLEFSSGQLSLTPFFSYSLATENDWDDYWTAGVRGAYWIDQRWGLTLGVSYTDFDDGTELLGIRAGIVFAY